MCTTSTSKRKRSSNSNSNSNSNSSNSRSSSMNSNNTQQEQMRRRVEARSQYAAKIRANNTSSRKNRRSNNHNNKNRRANNPPLPPPPPVVTGLPVVNVVQDDAYGCDIDKVINDDAMSLLSCDVNNDGTTATVMSTTTSTTAAMNPAKQQSRFKKRQRKMQAKIVELQQQVETLTSDLKSKQYGSSAKLEKLAAQRDAALEIISKKDEDMSRMMEMMKTMQTGASVKENQEATAKKEQEERCMMLTFECKSLKESLAKLEENKGADEMRVSSLQDEVLQLKSNISVYSAQLQIEKEIRAKSEQNESMERNERISIGASMLAMAKEHAVKEAKFKDQYEEEIQGLQEDVDAKDTDIQRKTEQIETQRDTITSLEEERNSMRGALNEKDKTEVNIIEENAQLRGELAVLKDQLKISHGKLETHEKESGMLIKELEEKLREGETLRRKLHNTVQELRGNIRVFARIRPFLPIDGVCDDTVPTISCKDESSLSITNEKGFHHFQFDRVFPAISTQENVFDEVSEFVQSALDGYHVTLFSYGQTGSGKTHTMQGMRDNLRGIIPRAIAQVGEYKKALENDGWSFEIHASMLEIYNENIRDLLRETEEDELNHDIKVTKDGERVVTNMTIRPVDPTNSNAIQKLMEQAARFRSVGATGMNQTSSRSHSVFTLHLKAFHSEQKEKLKGTLNLVDLAGSERLQRSGATGTMAKETAAINKSLSSLTDVFSSLGKKANHIPYRNSKLTYLLQPSFSGSGKTLMMVNLSPTEESFTESLSSLRFAMQVNQCELGKAKKSVTLDANEHDNTDAMSITSISSNSQQNAPKMKNSGTNNSTSRRNANTHTPISSGIRSRATSVKTPTSSRTSSLPRTGSSSGLRNGSALRAPNTRAPNSNAGTGKHAVPLEPSRSVRRKV